MTDQPARQLGQDVGSHSVAVVRHCEDLLNARQRNLMNQRRTMKLAQLTCVAIEHEASVPALLPRCQLQQDEAEDHQQAASDKQDRALLRKQRSGPLDERAAQSQSAEKPKQPDDGTGFADKLDLIFGDDARGRLGCRQKYTGRKRRRFGLGRHRQTSFSLTYIERTEV